MEYASTQSGSAASKLIGIAGVGIASAFSVATRYGGGSAVIRCEYQKHIAIHGTKASRTVRAPGRAGRGIDIAGSCRTRGQWASPHKDLPLRSETKGNNKH